MTAEEETLVRRRRQQLMEAIEVTLKEEFSEFRAQKVGKLFASHVPTAAPIDKEVFRTV
jgi:hypothetical protein